MQTLRLDDSRNPNQNSLLYGKLRWKTVRIYLLLSFKCYSGPKNFTVRFFWYRMDGPLAHTNILFILRVLGCIVRSTHIMSWGNHPNYRDGHIRSYKLATVNRGGRRPWAWARFLNTLNILIIFLGAVIIFIPIIFVGNGDLNIIHYFRNQGNGVNNHDYQCIQDTPCPGGLPRRKGTLPPWPQGVRARAFGQGCQPFGGNTYIAAPVETPSKKRRERRP